MPEEKTQTQILRDELRAIANEAPHHPDPRVMVARLAAALLAAGEPADTTGTGA